MMLSWSTYAVILGPIMALLGWLVWDTYFKTGKKVRVLLFEKVGYTKVFKGSYYAVEKKNKNLGTYLFCKKIGLRISYPRVEEFFAGNKVNTLTICKYASDDFRIMTVLKDEEYYQKGVSEDGVEFEVPYTDPIGITQTAREAIRFERAFHNEMNDFLKTQPTFWDKYGALFVNGMVVILFMLLVIFLVRKNNDLQMDMTAKFAAVADDYIEEVKSPSFMDRMVESYNREQVEANTPLT